MKVAMSILHDISKSRALGISSAAQKYGKLPYFDPLVFRVSKPAIEACSVSQTLDYADLQSENLVYSSNSLLECIRRYESSLCFFNEAELRTYPTWLLSQGLARCLCQHFGIARCLVQSNLANPKSFVPSKAKIYDLASDHFIEWQPRDQADKILSIRPYNVVGDIAGAVSYYLDVGSSKPSISTQMTKTFIELGDRYGYDYVGHDVQGIKLDPKTRKPLEYAFYIKYEARYLETSFEVEDKLYHISPLSKKDSILRFGLQPRSKTYIDGYFARHKDRIYLFNGLAKSAMLSFVQKADKQEYSSKNKMMVGVKKFGLFEIDRKKLPNLKLYQDNMFQLDDPNHPYALYTYSNIPPSALKFAGEFQKKQ